MKSLTGNLLPIAAVAIILGCSSNKNHGVGIAYRSDMDAPAKVATSTDYGYATPAYENSGIAATNGSAAASKPGVRPVSMPVASSRSDITVDEIRTHMRNQSAVIVDAREPREFRKGHVRGAINIPVGEEDAHMDSFRREVAPDQLVIIYCGGPQCPASENVASYLASQGFVNVRIYKPGWQQLSRVELP